MRFLVDEDLASARLLSALGNAFGAEGVLGPEQGTPDRLVWARAQRERAIVITANAKDFVPLARDDPGHAGLLLVAQQTLTAEEIGRRVARLPELFPGGIDGLVISVNGIGEGQASR